MYVLIGLTIFYLVVYTSFKGNIFYCFTTAERA